MAPTKHAAVARAKHTKRSKKALLAKARAAKLAKKTAPSTPVCPATDATSMLDVTIPVKVSASKRKLNYNQGHENCGASTVDGSVAFVNLANLSTLFGNLGCEVCGARLNLVTEKRTGSVLMLKVCCNSCQVLHASTMTAKTLSTSKHYDTHRRLVAAFLNLGLGFAGLESFCEVMGMDSMTSKTFNSHVKAIHKKMDMFNSQVKSDAVAKVRQAHGSLNNDILDITVSFDGSWHKRGHTSKHGLGVVIEATTGLAIDYHVMSTYCQVCSTTGKAMLKKGEASYQHWYDNHKDTCSINHSGSSGLMEVEAAKVMWQRSLQQNLRYTSFVSDGDCKTYNELTALAPYNVPIKKEECTNHVAKRLGTALRNLVTTESKLGRTLGGRKTGSLTKTKINLLQQYYKKAVASKNTSTAELREKILMTFNHASSTNETPKHHTCPKGRTSWCFWQRAMANNRPPPSHIGNSSCFISAAVADKVKPIYDRLTSDALLERCLLGMTQNVNESIHSKIWAFCPKHIFVGRGRIEIGAGLGIAEFNAGSIGLQNFLTNIGCEVNNLTLSKGIIRDKKRIYKAEKKESTEAKRRRKEIVTASILAQQQYLISEGGPSYESGKF